MGMLRIPFTGLLRRSRQMDGSGLPGQSMRAVLGVVRVSRSCVAPLGPSLELGVSGSAWLGKGMTWRAAPTPCLQLPSLLPWLLKAALNQVTTCLYFAVAVMQTASLPSSQSRSSLPHPSLPQQPRRLQLSAFVLECLLFIRPWLCA